MLCGRKAETQTVIAADNYYSLDIHTTLCTMTHSNTPNLCISAAHDIYTWMLCVSKLNIMLINIK